MLVLRIGAPAVVFLGLATLPAAADLVPLRSRADCALPSLAISAPARA